MRRGRLATSMPLYETVVVVEGADVVAVAAAVDAGVVRGTVIVEDAVGKTTAVVLFNVADPKTALAVLSSPQLAIILRPGIGRSRSVAVSQSRPLEIPFSQAGSLWNQKEGNSFNPKGLSVRVLGTRRLCYLKSHFSYIDVNVHIAETRWTRLLVQTEQTVSFWTDSGISEFAVPPFGTMSFDSGTSMLTKEIPFLISNPPLPLAASSSSNDDRGGGVGGRHREQHQNNRRSMAVAVADVAENRNDNNATVAKKMIGLRLIEKSSSTNTSNYSTSAAAGCNNNVDDGSLASRGMTSTFYSKVDNRTIITNGIAGKSSVIQLSIIGDKTKEKISAGGKEEGAVAVCHSLEIDLSSLLDSTSSHGGGNGFGSGSSSSMTMFDRVMGTSVYVTHPTTPPSTTQRRGGEGGSSDDGWEPWEGNDTPPTSSTTTTPLLHLRMIDIYGTIVSLTFTYPDMKPHDSSSSFLLPLSAPSSGLCRPHPGSIIETPNQTCFPTVTTVVFALNPHLYCVDFGNSSSIVGGIPKTRVWTNIHVLTSDPITDDDNYYKEQQRVVAPTSTTRRATRSTTISTPSTNTTTTATKRPKRESSISGILATATKRLMGIPDMDPDAKFEYHDDDDDDDTQLDMVGGGSGSIPPIAALTNLSLSTKNNNNDDDDYCDDNNNVARVATLHSDGSIRVWTAELSSSNKGDNIQKLLRIPLVQRIAIDSSSAAAAVGRGRGRTNTTTSRYINPPLPDTTVWDPRFDALTLRGRARYNENSGTFEYEIAVYIHCYTTNNTLSKKISGDGGSLVYIFQGDIVNNVPVEALMLPSGDTAMMQMLNLPNDTASVVDISWVKGRDLIVLLRQSTNDGSSNDDVSRVYYYTIGGNEMVENERVILAVYPLVEVPSKGFLSPTRGSSLNVLSYMTEPILPSNTTLPYLQFNHFGCTNYLSVEEELDRYICHSEATNSIIESTEMTTTDTVTKAQAQIDRAGLLAILQPFGRIRASALAIHRAMSSLNLLDVGVGPDEIRPTVIVSAMRKWTKKSAFQSSSTDLIPTVSADDTESHDGTTPTNSLSVYQAFTSATKKTAPGRDVRMYEDMDMDGESEASALEVNDVDTARLSHRLKWIRLLAEIRRQEVQLNEVLCLTMSADSSILFRGDMVTTITMDSESAATTKEPALAELSNQERNIMTGLDELAVELFTCISKDPKLRQLLSKVESSLYNGSSTASSFIHDWIEMGLGNIELLSQLEVLGRSAMVQLPIVDAHIQLLNELSQFDSKEIEAWLIPNTSASAIVCTRLAILDASSNSSVSFGHFTESNAPYHAAATLISARIESIRILSLSRLILVFGSPQVHPVPIQHGALRSTLYCTALIWSVHQQSSVDKQLTVLEEDLSKKIRNGAIHSGVHEIADSFVSIAFSSMIGGSLLFGKTEPHVALRLVAPLVEFRSQLITSEAEQKMREVVAHCLLIEAAALLKHAERSSESDVSPMSLWRLASKSLLHKSATSIERYKVISNLMNRVGTLERHLNSVQGCRITLPLCCEVTLEAIQDAISAISSLSTPEMWKKELQSEIPTLWDSALHVSMRGSLWDDAFQACINNPIATRRRANFKVLILGMIDAGGLGKLIDMSLSVVELDFSMAMQMDSHDGLDNQATDERVDLFDLAAEIIEEAAVEQGTSRTGTSYWSCLYALHASRGHWRQAAYAMDFFGKATSESVSSYKSKSQEAKALSKAASKKVMDDACLAAHACFHAISLVDKPSDRYLLTGNPDSPTEPMLLTEEDLEHRAVRAMALRTFYMDENSPDAVGNILEMSSRDTIDTLARFAYYEQAISIALSVSSKRKGLLPGGVDLFNDALQHILCVYLVPTAITKSTAMKNDGSGLHNLQSRSKLAQIRASSSSCALGSAESVVTANANSCVSIGQSENMLQSVMAMNLLQQYTTMYSKRCHGLGLSVANSILGKDSELPMWLKELCIFGVPNDGRSNDGLFAQSSKESCGNSDPAGLMRLYIKYHQYGEACNVVTLLLSQRTTLAASCRLPEKGSIDYVPYDLIDMLWDIIESIITSNSCAPSDGVHAKVQLLIKKRECMEQALENHFESLKISEDGLSSARVISMHK